jgi:ABC-2 type transport system permease protein
MGGKKFNLKAIYALWFRDLKIFFRSASRIIGSVAMPLFFLAFLGLGFSKMPLNQAGGGSYIQFLVPGIIGMNLLFSSMFAGLSLLWDREDGFLKEIMVAPVERISIVVGRTAAGVTTSLLQAMMIFLISFLLGFRVANFQVVFLSLLFMLLISTAFNAFGLIFAANMKDFHGFNLIINFIMFPFFFLSGALFPITNLPFWMRFFSYLDPLTYGVDGLRGILIGYTQFPVVFDLIILGGITALLLSLGAYFFEKSESV